MPLSNPVKPTFASVVTGTAVAASGLTGAASQSRLVGGNASGAPASGTFAVGDHVANADGTVYVCTVAGTPGTWVQVGVPTYGTPGSSAVGDTAAAGSATTVARSDHLHGREAFGTPVNIDASLTSLSAGSLTTVARADHVHTVSKVPVLLGTTTLGGAAASISVASIPAGFSSLHIRWICPPTQRAGQATDAIVLRLNDDAGSNYRSGSSSQTYLIGMGVAGATGLASPVISVGIIDIFGYASTNYYKQSGNSFYVVADNVNYSVGSNAGAGIWLNTASVTKVSLLSVNGANLSSNTAIWVYGMP